jgi:hypothetical protein
VLVSSAVSSFIHLNSKASEIKWFRSRESLVRNVDAYYGDRSAELSSDLPHDADTARQFFDPNLRADVSDAAQKLKTPA